MTRRTLRPRTNFNFKKFGATGQKSTVYDNENYVEAELMEKDLFHSDEENFVLSGYLRK